MKKNPEFIKISYHSETYKLRPIPEDYQFLVNSIIAFIPDSPSCPLITYKDESGDELRICNDKSLEAYYLDLITSPNLVLNLEANLEEIIQKNKIRPHIKTNESDIINLLILDLIDINDETIQSIKIYQTEFSKIIISEIIDMLKENSIEETAEKLNVP